MLWLGWLLALLPLTTGVLQLALDSRLQSDGAVRLDVLYPFLPVAVFAGVAAGLGRQHLSVGLTRMNFLAILLAGGVMLGTTTFVAIDPAASAMALSQRLLAVLMCAALVFVIDRAGSGLGRALLLAVFGTTLLHLPLVAWLYVNMDAYPGLNWRGGPVGFWHVRIWGMALSAGLGAAAGVWLLLRDRGIPTVAAFWGAVALLWLALFWSGTRGGVVSVGLAWGFSLALFPRRMGPAVLPFALAMLTGAGLSTLLVTPESAYGILNSLRETTAAADADGVSAGRLTMWTDALRLIAERPLTGWGFDQYRHLSEGRFQGWEQVHNAVLELLLAFGAIGGGAIMVLILRFWLTGVAGALRRPGAVRIGALTGLNTLLLFSLVDGVLYHLDPLILTAILFALLLAPDRTDQEDGQTVQPRL
jgi:O-antigen ligase